MGGQTCDFSIRAHSVREHSIENGQGWGIAAWPQGTLLKFLVPEACEAPYFSEARDGFCSSPSRVLGPSRVAPARGRPRGDCGKSTPLRATAWAGRGSRRHCRHSPTGGGWTSHLRSTPLLWFRFGPGFQPRLRTSPDLGQVTGGCFPSHWSGSAFPLPDSPDYLGHYEKPQF